VHHRWLSLALVLLASCGQQADEHDAEPVTLAAWEELTGWGEATLLPAADVFLSTCPRLDTADWAAACAAAADLATERDALAWAEEYFLPVRMDGAGALVTGYFEPVFAGAKEKTDIFSAPILSRPDDLVAVDLGQFREDLKGKRLAGRVVNGRLVPYADREQINDAPPANAEILGWMQPDDLFFLQIQGSGVVDLGGEERRIGYSAQNGHVYHAIGKTLVQEGHIPLKDVTMQSIRRWLAEASDADAARVRHTNPSYVFFLDRGPALSDEGPYGTSNVPLTANVSVAVDPLAYPLGAPLWIVGSDDVVTLRGLHIAQDTGGAIKGADRVDLFTGRGDVAGDIAGRLKLDADVVVLLPKAMALRLAAKPTS